MLSNNNFVRQSLDINLFFLRIMKEHALFLAVGFLPKNSEYIKEALSYNSLFNKLLNKATDLSKGTLVVSDDAITDYTLEAEKFVSKLTDVEIDTSLTHEELSLRKQSINRINDNDLINEVRILNDRAITATRSLIRFKTKLLNDVLTCNIMVSVYPLLIDHIRREAILFVDLLTGLQNNLTERQFNELIENEIFWNRIMEEHSKFIRGLLDPTEEELIKVANNFANNYKNMNEKVNNASNNPNLIQNVTNDIVKLTKQIKEFNTQATLGLLKCGVKSILNPLLADHVLRESNHYLRLLENLKKH